MMITASVPSRQSLGLLAKSIQIILLASRQFLVLFAEAGMTASMM